MIELISCKIYNYMIHQTDVDHELEDVYKYGIEITLSSALNIILVMVISFIFGDPLSGICFLVSIISLRSFCGGHHASNYFKCNCSMVMLFITAHLTGKLLTHYGFLDFRVMLALSMIAFLPVCAYAPVKNKRKPLSKSKARKCRILSVFTYILLCVPGLILTSYGISYGSIIIIALLEVSALILIEINIQRRYKDEVSESSGESH